MSAVIQAMLFFAVVLTILGAIHYYVWRRLVRDTTVRGRGRRLGTLGFGLLFVALLIAMIGFRVLPGAAQALAWPGNLWLALLFYLLLALLALEVPVAVARRLIQPARPGPVEPPPGPVEPPPGPVEPPPGPVEPAVGPVEPAAVPVAPPTVLSASPPAAPARDTPDRDGGGSADAGRRRLLARSAAVTAGLAAATVTGMGMRTALGPPRINRVQIPLVRLSASADGLRIALVSDVHLGPLRGRAHTQRIVDAINSLDADLVAVVGDLVDGTVAELGHAVAPLRQLRSRLGSFFVTGNHEYYSGYEPWLPEVARLGLRPLRNARVELPGGVDLIGVNDDSGESFDDGPDYDRAFAGRDPARTAVVLAHQPVQAYEAAARGADLQLSGHTHGGQIWPFDYVVRLQQPVVSGLATVDGMPVFVTNGAGFWGPPVRVGAPPEVVLVQLRRK